MNEINICNLNEIEFAKEIKKKVISIDDSYDFVLNDGLCKNFEIFLYYIDKLKIKKIKIVYKDSVDILCYRIFQKKFVSDYIKYAQSFSIVFEGFKEYMLYELLGDKDYFVYCVANNIEPKWNEKKYTEQVEKIDQYKKLDQYENFQILKDNFKNYIGSSFNFPNEENADRFVFYFYVYSDDSRNKIIELIKKLNMKNKTYIIDYIREMDIRLFSYFAIGFLYNEKKELARETFYLQFSIIATKNRIVKKYIELKHKIKLLENDSELIWYYAIDFFNDNRPQEIKIYQEHVFKKKLQDLNLNSLLREKPSIKVNKYVNCNIVDTKYEFHLKKFFKLSERKKLQEIGFDDLKSRILSIYVNDDGCVVKKIFYDI